MTAHIRHSFTIQKKKTKKNKNESHSIDPASNDFVYEATILSISPKTRTYMT